MIESQKKNHRRIHRASANFVLRIRSRSGALAGDFWGGNTFGVADVAIAKICCWSTVDCGMGLNIHTKKSIGLTPDIHRVLDHR